jgi:hypothetical protein
VDALKNAEKDDRNRITSCIGHGPSKLLSRQVDQTVL